MRKYFNKRIAAVLLLSFSSGLPLMLTGSTLQAWYTVSGIGIMTIGTLSLVGQPYVFKFLWAPIMDRFTLLGLGRRRGWIFLMQFALVIALSVMAFLHPKTQPWLLASAGLLVAFFSASQDIAIDAYRTDVLPAEERGLGASANTIGYRIAMIVSGALALIFAAEIGWRATYLIMAGLIVLELLVTLWSPQPALEAKPPKTLGQAIVEPWKEFMARRYAIWILVFIIIYKLCDNLALSLNTYFLLHGVGFTLIELGSVAKIVSLGGAFLGALAGGLLFAPLGMYRSLMIFGFLQMLSNLAFILLVIIGKNLMLMAGILFFETFTGGLSTVAFVAFLMALCNRNYTATQFALFSAAMAVGRVVVGPIAAYWVKTSGWIDFYIWTFIIGLPALALLWWINRRVDLSAEHIAAAA